MIDKRIPPVTESALCRPASSVRRQRRAQTCRRIFTLLLTVALLSGLFAPASMASELAGQQMVNGWCLQAINAPQELQSTGSSSVRIALIDSGISLLKEWQDQGSIAVGYNYVLHSTVTYDLLGHGSRAAAIILGCSNANSQLIGLGSRATLVPLVWISKLPSGVLVSGGVAALTNAIRDAVDLYHCQIINISSGLVGDDPALCAAVEYAEQQGVIVVAAAGNSNQYAPSDVFYPAAYQTVVGVGAVNSQLQVAAWSQRNGVMVTAPGEQVYSLANTKTSALARVSGTSYAAAYVTAMASAVLSAYPNLTPAQFRQALQASAQDLGEPGYDPAYGYGLVDLTRCLSLGDGSFDSSPSVSSGGPVTFPN